MPDQKQLSAEKACHPGASDEKPYPPYYYLWHLCALGVLQADRIPGSPCPEIVSTLWDELDATYGAKAHEETIVALIDVGVGGNHPNLAQVDLEKAIDLVTHPYGARRKPAVPDGDLEREGTAQFFQGLRLDDLDLAAFSKAERSLLDTIATELRDSSGVCRMEETFDAALPSHGTAVAGLVVGDPGFVVMEGKNPVGTVALEGLVRRKAEGCSLVRRDNTVPYFGVDPFSHLVPIKTSFDVDARPLIAAFLYAFQIGADVILLPRDIPDPTRGVLPVKGEIGGAEPEKGAASAAKSSSKQVRADDWSVLNKLIIAISKATPVICAAGNSGESQLIYPACLAGEKEPNGIVAVGAVNAQARRAGYSNYGKGLSVVAPSDDGEIYNRNQIRIDHNNPATRVHAYGLGSFKKVSYSHYTVTTTDIPGAWGYAGGTVPYVASLAPENNPGFAGGYYTAFGGTSASAGLVAGVAALMARTYKAASGGKAKLAGTDAKRILMDTASPRMRLPTDQDAKADVADVALAPDIMNRLDEPLDDPSYFFGAGLVNAAAAIERIQGKQ